MASYFFDDDFLDIAGVPLADRPLKRRLSENTYRTCYFKSPVSVLGLLLLGDRPVPNQGHSGRASYNNR